MLEPKNLKYRVGLNYFRKFGPVRLAKLNQAFPDMKAAFLASADKLIAAGIEPALAHEFVAARTNLEPERLMEELAREQIQVLTQENPIYPKLLKDLPDAPPLLYFKGEPAEEDAYSLAIVGSRKYSTYGKQAATQLAGGLARANITIVSGMALGIDAIAHSECLKAGGRTVGVLATGLDNQSIYPAANRYLAEKIIASGGFLLSEFPPGTPALKHHFPQRNRLISGLALGTLVVEAGEKSGSLITAGYALEQNREVFAVPGSIYSPASRGTNLLIKQGAKPATEISDILEALNLADIATTIEAKKSIPETPEEKLIAQFLSREPLHIDELIRLTKLDTAKINSTLIIMEMKGMTRNIGNMRYVIV
jgi:DNA processing protein